MERFPLSGHRIQCTRAGRSIKPNLHQQFAIGGGVEHMQGHVSVFVFLAEIPLYPMWWYVPLVECITCFLVHCTQQHLHLTRCQVFVKGCPSNPFDQTVVLGRQQRTISGHVDTQQTLAALRGCTRRGCGLVWNNAARVCYG